MQKIKGIPDWFNLNKYDGTSHFKSRDWYENLRYRRMFFSFYRWSQSQRVNVSELRRKDYIEKYNNIYKLIFYTTLIKVNAEESVFHSDITANVLNNEVIIDCYRSLFNYAPPSFLEYIYINKENYEDAIKFRDSNPELDAFLLQDFKSVLDDELFIKINLHATDEHIIEDFKKLLFEQRNNDKETSARKIFTNNDFNEWNEFKILPYLDLKMYALISGNHLTQVVIGNLIFPDEQEIDTTERIRRTTKKRAEWLISYPVLDALGVQVRKENSKPA